MVLNNSLNTTVWNFHYFRYFQQLWIFGHPLSVLHSSNYRGIDCIRRSSGSWIIFERLTASSKLVEPSMLYCGITRHTFTINGNQAIINFFDTVPFFAQKLDNCTVFKLNAVHCLRNYTHIRHHCDVIMHDVISANAPDHKVRVVHYSETKFALLYNA